MKELYLHVGHGKTGSSFIQHNLVLNKKELHANGFFYPQVVSSNESNAINSGNGGVLYSYKNDKNLRNLFKNNDKILLSREQFLKEMAQTHNQQSLKSFCKKFQIEKVNILLFIRNPLEHLSSMYQQNIKRLGFTEDINKFSDSYKVTSEVILFLQFCKRNNYKVQIYNYSLLRKNILNLTTKWLNIENIKIKTTTTVNRSLTYSEMEFLRKYNKIIGNSKIISNKLITELTEIKANTI